MHFPHSSINSIHFFYFNHVVRIWNSLPIINLSLSSTIKKLIKTFLWQHFLSTFSHHNTCSWFLCCPCHLCLNNSSINFSTLEINYNYSFISHRLHTVLVCLLQPALLIFHLSYITSSYTYSCAVCKVTIIIIITSQ